MSFAEFTYPLMQAWDWWYMFHTKGIQMQIGGSDQFGNITAGIDAVKYIVTHHPDPIVRHEAAAVGEPFGFTVPLLTTASGQKFGKSAGNAIWLDIEQTSSFDLYKYFLATADADVEKYLKMFTFMPLKDIEALVEEHKKSPGFRIAQHKLAGEFVEIIHGAEESKVAETHHRLLFRTVRTGEVLPAPSEDSDDQYGQGNRMNLTEKPQAHDYLPRHIMYQKNVGKILHAAGIATSATEGHRLVARGGAYIGTLKNKSVNAGNAKSNDGHISWQKIQPKWAPEDMPKFFSFDDLLLFRKGKSTIRILQVVSDEDYAFSGDGYPGMSRGWRMDVLRAIQLKKSLTKAEQENIAKLLADDESFLKEQLEDASAKRAPKEGDEPKVDFAKKSVQKEAADDQASWVDKL